MSFHMTSSREKPWHSAITIDFIADVLSRSLLNPFVAWLFPLCLRAVSTPYHSPSFIVAGLYATALTLSWMLSIVDGRVAYGIPRAVDWDEEVVVITGGGSGLGKILAEMYSMRGTSVAILDVREPPEESEGLANVNFYRCDVGDPVAVEKAKEQIERDLGTPTLLINNAGIVNAKPLLELTTEDVRRNFDVNLLSHFHTIRAFLPGMLASDFGGTIVTIASVLGKLGASHLSDYTAAKAGLIAMHTSLRAELSSPAAPDGSQNIRTILVTPGQLATPLFAGLDTPSNFFGPVVEPVQLAREIARLVDGGWSGQVSMPLYARWVDWLGVLPAGLQRVVRILSGIDRAMEASRKKNVALRNSGLVTAATGPGNPAQAGRRKEE